MPQSDGCTIADATVFVDSRITLPDWEAPPNPDPSLATQWADFLEALREHEAGHQALVMRGAERVRQTLRGVHGPHCEPLRARADSAAQAVLASIRDDDARYDAETRHGATQGAIWPPASPSPLVVALR